MLPPQFLKALVSGIKSAHASMMPLPIAFTGFHVHGTVCNKNKVATPKDLSPGSAEKFDFRLFVFVLGKL